MVLDYGVGHWVGVPVQTQRGFELPLALVPVDPGVALVALINTAGLSQVD